jgi:glycosyltransferase involved in cell wall biosynthesis
MPALYKAADALVIPSRGEGWGRPHCEAMAMRLPVIATVRCVFAVLPSVS